LTPTVDLILPAMSPQPLTVTAICSGWSWLVSLLSQDLTLRLTALTPCTRSLIRLSSMTQALRRCGVQSLTPHRWTQPLYHFVGLTYFCQWFSRLLAVKRLQNRNFFTQTTDLALADINWASVGAGCRHLQEMDAGAARVQLSAPTLP
jgi:hypothetical protein